MKKLLVPAFFVMILSACNFQVPESFSVKTDAEIGLNGGKTSFDFSESLDIDSVFDGLKSDLGNSFKVYDYDDGSGEGALTYVMKYSVMEVPIDVGSMIGDIDFDSAINDAASSFGDPIDFDLPEIKEGDSSKLSVSFNIPGVPMTPGVPVTVPSFIGNQTETVEIQPVEIDLSEAAEYFDMVGIKTGYIIYGLKKPDNWSGITVTPHVSITGCGLDNLPEDGIPDTDYLFKRKITMDDSVLDLTLSSKKITIDGTVDIEYGPGSVISQDDIDFEYQMEVVEIQNTTIDLTKPGFSSISTSGNAGDIDLPSDLVKFVNTISFGTAGIDGNYYKHDADGNPGFRPQAMSQGFGIICKVTNELDCDIPLTIKSRTFNLNETKALEGNISERPVKWGSFNTIDFTPLKNQQNPKMDITYEMATSFLIRSAVLGTTKKIEFAFEEVVFDWDKADVSLTDLDQNSIQGEESFDGLSMDSLLDGLPIDDSSKDAIKIYEIPVFMQVKGTSLLNDLAVEGKMQIEYETQEGTLVKNILGTPEVTEPIKFVNNPPAWPDTDKIKKENPDHEEIIKCFTKNDYENNDGQGGVKYYSIATNFEDVINKKPSSTKFIYDISFNSPSLDVYSAQIDESSDENIRVDMIIKIPFMLDIGTGIELDIMEMTDESYYEDPSKDLLGRDEKIDDIENYQDSIKYIRLTYCIENSLFSGVDLEAVLDDTANTGIVKKLVISGEEEKFDFSGSDVKLIMNTIPYHPSFKVLLKSEIDENSGLPKPFKVRRGIIDGGEFSFSAKVSVKLDKDNPVKVEF